MNDLEPSDPLWSVLGRAKTVEPSPFFARNVVREARRIADLPMTFGDRLRSIIVTRALFASAACALIAVTMLVISQRDGSGLGSAGIATISEETTEAFDPASEMAAVEYLGQLMAVVDPGQLDDAALADLFF